MEENKQSLTEDEVKNRIVGLRAKNDRGDTILSDCATVHIGRSADVYSWQGPFAPEEKCHKCGKTTRLALVVKEQCGSKTLVYVSNLYGNEPDAFWPHDAVAVAIYFCIDVACAKATAIWNQA